MQLSQGRKSWAARAAQWSGGALMALGATLAQAIAIQVVKPDGTPIDVPFRWVLQEDRTWDVIPGLTGTALAPVPTDTQSLKFHRSHMPVIESGQTANVNGTAATAANLSAAALAGKRYYLSVLPHGRADGSPAFQMSGASIRPNANGSMPATVRVVVNPTPIETAQISLLVYLDNNPINNAPSALGTQEYGLCGWDVHLYDAGGTYGASGGRVGYDAFGNPLGTTYDAAGNVLEVGKLVIKTDRNGVYRIKNIAPAKYTVFVVPPHDKPTIDECPSYYPTPVAGGPDAPPLTPWKGDGAIWMQTHTIEGTQGVDVWVKANEPTFFKEFGPPGHHAFIGFVPSFNAMDGSAANVATGRVINIHMSRPPVFTFHDGLPVTECRIGLNEMVGGAAVGNGRGVYAAPCNPDGTFSIAGLKPNTQYQLGVWEKSQGSVFGKYNFVTGDTGSIDLGNVPVFNWFGKVKGKVCDDPSETGQCVAGSVGIPGQAVNLRFRDGSVYQSVATNDDGEYGFSEVFPFFNWLVAEVDYLRFKATGVTAMADAGGSLFGPVAPGPAVSTREGAAAASVAETTTGETILQGMQLFLGQTNVMDWGKRAYVGTENGGISGKINYSSTRAESDPRYAGAENNEPGIPGVTVRLYKASATNPRVAAGPMIAEAVSDSWDAAEPTACIGDPYVTPEGTPIQSCYDGMRNYNQVRGAVYDGGYAFVGLTPGNYIVQVIPPVGYEVQKEEDKNVDFGDSIVVSTLALPPECVGTRPYPVPAELDLFPGVEIPAEFRDNPPTATYAGYTGKKRPYCDTKAVSLNAGLNAAMDFHIFTKTPLAAAIRGMILDDTANEFNPQAPAFGEKFAPPFMPVSLRDHTGREISRVYSDRFGIYNAMVPSTFAFNVPMPSGIAPNMVSACLNSPYRPVKDANTGADVIDPVSGRPMMEKDPHFNKSYSQFCYTFQYLPGKTTYLDTPVVPIAAFAGPQQYSLDCAHPDAVPAIRSVTGINNVGPWVGNNRRLTIRSMGNVEVLNPLWDSENPGTTVPKTVTRNHGFGGNGTVSINGQNVPVGNIVSWNNNTIVLDVPAGFSSGTLLVTRANGQVTARGVTVHIGGPLPTVVRAGQSIQAAINAAQEGALITVEPGLYEETVIVDRRVRLQGFGAGGTLINAVTQPAEKLVAWRVAACNRVHDVTPTPGGGTGANFLLPGQLLPVDLRACLTGDTADNAPLLFGDAEAPGFFVMLKSDGNAANPQPRVSADRLQIDGFTVSGADHGGGIIVNGYAQGIEISNNLITGNQGVMAGGVRLGHPGLVAQDLPVGSRNTDANIHHNEIVQNGDTAGAVGGGGGGLGLYFGATNYRVTNNFVCGNHSSGNGGGMAHLGVSDNGLIDNNRFLWNSTFNSAISTQGGGLSVSGQVSLAAGTGISTGTGNVRISNNTFLGNLAGAGDGGGISVFGSNGNELTAANNRGYQVNVLNNAIVNNVAAVAGGGMALQDAANTNIVNNTIARNDNTSTAARAFPAGAALRNNTTNTALSSSLPQYGAGVAAYLHSAVLAQRLGEVVSPLNRVFANPEVLDNNIVYQNRVYHWDHLKVTAGSPAIGGLVFDGYSDLEVVDAQLPMFEAATPATNNAPGTWVPVAGQRQLTPTNALMTSITQYAVAAPNNNVKGDSANAQYLNAATFNGPRDAVLLQGETSVQGTATSPAAAGAFDEGGNFIEVRYGPLTQHYIDANGVRQPYFNYDITAGSQAANIGRNRRATGATFDPILFTDRDGLQRQPIGTNWDAGAYRRP
jgi:large repetitive protein